MDQHVEPLAAPPRALSRSRRGALVTLGTAALGALAAPLAQRAAEPCSAALPASSGARAKQTFLAAQYHRIAARRGKKAIVAVAHSLLVLAYHIIARREPYRELGADDVDRQRPIAAANRLVKRLRGLGYEVQLGEPQPATAPEGVLAATPRPEGGFSG